MFGPTWSCSERRHPVRVEAGGRIPLADGTTLAGSWFRPDTDAPVPAILSVHAYNNEFQLAPIHPAGFSYQRGWIEAGDPAFFARRGYAHGVFNVRGIGASSGEFQAMGPREVDDIVEAIAWIAAQPWCSGQVAMFGISYFASIQLHVAMRRPPALRAIFCPFGLTDFYRDMFYHGGILSHRFLLQWKDKFDAVRYRSWFRERHGEAAYRAALQRALDDEEISEVPGLVAALRHPEGADAFLADIVIQPFDDTFYAERRVDYGATDVPAYLGACWGLFGLHLPGAFRSWARWQGPKKLLVGPPLYLDRPLTQLHHEALRWFDHFLLGNDTGFLDEPPIRLFVPGRATWRSASRWPLPETRWMPFFLHEQQLLHEHDPWPLERSTSFEESPFGHGEAVFRTAPMVEDTVVMGPFVLELWCRTTDTELLLHASVFAAAADGSEEELTRGWLRASHREVDPLASEPWRPHHPHRRHQPVVPLELLQLRVDLCPGARRLAPGDRLGLRLKGADDEPPPDAIRGAGYGHLQRPTAARIEVCHDEDHASRLLVPVVEGNVLGTFLSGGALPPAIGPLPIAKFRRPKGESAQG
ncbi:MAG TPA: CocE/NonD family hydrolase [Candidatus Micrarchaeia archaeon]|nr:CocE/NonD family hydrolase [Candidatus Micrarchaeia archaeon]